jgi:hypothetical protein
MITTGTTPVVGRFIAEMTTTEVEASVAELAPAAMKGTDPPTRTPATAVDLTATGAQIVLAAMKGTGRQAGTPVNALELAPASTKGIGPPMRMPAAAAGLKTVPAQRPGLLKETTKRLEDMLNPAVRAASARAPSATTTTADRRGAFRHAEAPASAGEEERVAEVVAGIDNRSFVGFPIHREI